MITTIGSFISKVKKQYDDWGSPQYAWFRGEPIAETRLLPKLYRPKADGSLHNENKLLQMFRMKAPSFASTPTPTPPRNNTDEWLFLAQHIGLPTRLLDWTENALIALYFAVKEEHPVIWMLDPIKLDQYVVSTLNELNKHNEQNVVEFDEFPLTWVRPAPPQINIGSVNINGAWEYDKGITLPVAIHPTYLHPRMSAQRSVFTVHGTDKRPIDLLIPNHLLARFVIEPIARRNIIRVLAILGIQEATAFPDLDGLARELTLLY